MKTGKMITHLHNQHDYRFVECSIEHEHTPACFELPESHFYYITDAKLIHKADKTPLPTTNLREFRRSAVQKTQAKKIAASHAPSTDDASTDESESMSITAPSIASASPMDKSHLSHLPATSTAMPASSLSTTSASTSVPATAAESANAMDIRACMAAFTGTYSNAADVAKHAELLVDLDMPVSEWPGIERADLEEMDIHWSGRDLVRWKSFAKNWVASRIS